MTRRWSLSRRTTPIHATDEPAAPWMNTTGQRDDSPSSRRRTRLSPTRSRLIGGLGERWNSCPRSLPRRTLALRGLELAHLGGQLGDGLLPLGDEAVVGDLE